MIYRKILKEIEDWNALHRSEALLIDGARQVGKTFIVREFARSHFKSFVELNFLKDKKLKGLFLGVSDEKEVLTRISAVAGVKLIPNETLIFLDEIQECPEAVTYIKFLVDEGRYRYIMSGSLLGVELKDIRSVPVGYLRELTMYPVDFEEFARAMGVPDEVFSHLKTRFCEIKPVDPVVNDRMRKLFSLYLVVGGMPAAVQTYLDTQNISEVVKIQKGILVEYRKDAAKYDRKHKLQIHRVIDLLPEELNKKNKRFFISDLKDGGRYERMEGNFVWLKESGIALPCTVVDDPKVPLRLSHNSGFFKLFMNDVGLLAAMYMDGIQFKILSGDTSINSGSIYENFVAQELKAHGFELHYFMSDAIGEVDFIVQLDGKSVPLEAKSGRHYRTHAALDRLLGNEGYGIRRSIVLSDYNVSREKGVDYLPIYMVMFLEHDRLPTDATYVLPSLDMTVNPHFKGNKA